MKPASRFKRFIAYIVDIILAYLITWPIFKAVEIIYFPNIKEIHLYQPYLIITFTTSIILWALYVVFFESSKYQATPGKLLLKLYVATSDNKKITAMHAFVRYVIFCIPSAPYLTTTIIFVPTLYMSKEMSISEALITLTTLALSLLLLLIWYIPIYFTKERKCVHDMISDTRVYTKTKS